MGLWGAAQAIAFAAGGLVGTGAVDVARAVLASDVDAYALVFAAEALMFLGASQLAARVVGAPVVRDPRQPAQVRALARSWARE